MEEIKNQGIKNWALEDRPREKLMQRGKESLTDVELLAILIGSGTKGETVVDLSRRILKSVDNNLHNLGKLSVQNLMQSFKGIGQARAISIISALELGRRRKEADIFSRSTITSSSDVFEYMQGILMDLDHEQFWVLHLNRANKILDKTCVSHGGVSSTVIDMKILFQHAISRLASGIILCHNHPSGSLEPSKEDITITNKIKEAAKLLDINVLDHIIISDTKYFSFADNGIF